MVPQNDISISLVFLLIGLLVFFSFNYLKQSIQTLTLNNLSFFVPSLAVILIISLLSLKYPTFSFIFMIIVSCIIAPLTFPYNISKNFKHIQGALLHKILLWLDKALILDYLSVIFVKFFATPLEVYYRRLFLLFIVNFMYILVSRVFFVKTIFLGESVDPIYLLLIYIGLFAGISVIYIRLLLNLSTFFVYAAIRIDPSLLSPSILYVLDQEEPLPMIPKDNGSQGTSSEKRYAFVNVNLSKQYYRQYFSGANTNSFRYLGYGLAICGTAVACGTFWYTRVQAQASMIQAEASIIQAEQARQQTYHTAREADVAAVDSGLITKDEYYRRHPEDKPT